MFAVLHIADFALHAVLRTEPGHPDRPAALFATRQKKSVVLAATPAARALGIEPGMTAPQAVARHPDLLIRTPCATAEAEARAALLAVGFTLSPAIEDTAPGICTADLKGFFPASPEPNGDTVINGRARCPPRAGSGSVGSKPDEDIGFHPSEPARSMEKQTPLECTRLIRTAAAAIAELAQLGLPATAGLARTPLLALYAAKAASSPDSFTPTATRGPQPVGSGNRGIGHRSSEICHLEIPKVVSQIPNARSPVSDFKLSALPTDGNNVNRSRRNHDEPCTHRRTCDQAAPVLVVTDEPAFLRPLPLATADPSPELAPVLASWGLRTLGDLTALPRDEIVLRFGREGLALWQRATGGDVRPLRPVGPTRRFAATIEFEEEIETLEPLLFILRRFLDRLTLELRAAQLVAAEVELTLRLDDDTRHTRNFRLPEPTADAEILFRALHTHLESLRTDAAIGALDLQLAPVRPLVRQQGLFETGLRDPHGFAETLARVSALVSAGRVGTPQREDTHRPDAVKLLPPPAVVPPPAAPPVHPPFGLPLRRFRPPLPANLEFTQGERQPTYVWTEHFHGPISHLRGPWRSSGDWWESGRRWARTEWDIALANGGLYRLLLIGEAYFIEGEYD